MLEKNFEEFWRKICEIKFWRKILEIRFRRKILKKNVEKFLKKNLGKICLGLFGFVAELCSLITSVIFIYSLNFHVHIFVHFKASIKRSTNV